MKVVISGVDCAVYANSDSVSPMTCIFCCVRCDLCINLYCITCMLVLLDMKTSMY